MRPISDHEIASFEDRMRMLLEKGRYTEGLQAAIDATTRSQVTHGMQSLQAAICHYWQGVLYCRQQRYEDAGRHLYSAKEIQRLRLGEEHWRTVRTLYETATVYYHQKFLAEALRQFQHVLALEKTILGVDHADLAPTLEFIGHCCSRLGRFDDAAQRYTEAWRLRCKTLGDRHEQTRAVQRCRNAAMKRQVPANITDDSSEGCFGVVVGIGGGLFVAYALGGEQGFAAALLLPVCGFIAYLAFGFVSGLISDPQGKSTKAVVIVIAVAIALVLLGTLLEGWHTHGPTTPYNDAYEVWIDNQRGR